MSCAGSLNPILTRLGSMNVRALLSFTNHRVLAFVRYLHGFSHVSRRNGLAENPSFAIG